MPDLIPGHLYDYPKYYDLVFGSDWKAEFDFLLACFKKYGRRKVRRLFEPACGTGRLMVRLAQAGFEVHGNDLNPRAVEYCNRRLVKHGLQPTAVVGDMADFQVKRKFDAAFNMINSVRHLPSESAAEAHLHCTADALKRGGLYLLGLHLTPVGEQQCTEESWSARRGNLAVVSHMQSTQINLRRRAETVAMTFDVYTPTRHFRLKEQLNFRTYTARQMQKLLEKTGRFQVLATYDFAYQIDQPLEINEQTEDIIYVLKSL